MGSCLGCGAALSRRSQKTFCSVACQQHRRQEQLLAIWLSTGAGAPRGEHTNFIRLHLLECQQNECAICGCPDQWSGQPLALILDHVDGDSTNNARANLRLVCPNCDSQLPTYKSRNRGRGRAWRSKRYADGKSY